MQRSILKHYSLYPDLTRLNHSDYYQPDFDTSDILNHFAAINNNHHLPAIKRSCAFFLKNLSSTKHKDVFVVLKWLVATHKLIHAVVNHLVIEQLSEALNKMGRVDCQEEIEEYIQSSLIVPYKQYLQKLCFLTACKLSSNQKPQRPSFDKENHSCDVSQHFLKLNLVRFAIKELQFPCKELLGFFYQAYPYLCNFSRLVYSDLKAILKQMGRRSKLVLPGVSYQDIQSLEQSIRIFEIHHIKNSTFLETPIKQAIVTDFFNSYPRNDLQIEPFQDCDD